MKPTAIHNPPVMQEISPATVTLTISVKAAQALAALLASVQMSELNEYGLPSTLIPVLDPHRMLHIYNSGGWGLSLCFRKNT